MVQRAVERVLKVLDLPRRSDIEALNENLDRVARAIEGLGQPSRSDDEPEPPPAHPGD
jgi:polyhydroxyalkanoate synthesis regulator phasin